MTSVAKLAMNEAVAKRFGAFPNHVRPKLEVLRQTIIDVATNTTGLGDLTETLKWGQPSYLVKGGSTVRLGEHKSAPGSYALFFTCSSNLVETFEELYGHALRFEGNRAIVFYHKDKLPMPELEHCIALALQYHKLKHIPLLGA